MKIFTLLLCFLAISSAVGQAKSGASIRDAALLVEVSLKGHETTFMAGQPVSIHYQITAPTNRSIGFVTGNWNTAWYEVSVRDREGRLISAFKDARPPRRSGFSPKLYPDTVPAKQKVEGDINLNRWVNLCKPGEYTLSFHIKMRYILLEGWRDSMESDDFDRLEKESSAYDKEVQLSFSLTETNQNELIRQCAGLRNKLINAPDQWTAEKIADDLFSYPESIAYVQGGRLVAQGVYAPAVAKALARTHNKRAVDLLVRLGKMPKPASAEYSEWNIPGLLRELRGVAEPELRQYIDDALAKNEKRFQPSVLVTD